jgi:Uncharacterized protein involved in cysteine biosynthesis
MDAFRGIFLVFRTPRLWIYSVGPLLAAFVAYVLLGLGGWFLIAPRLSGRVADLGFGQNGAVATEFAAVLLWLLVFPFLFTLLAAGFIGLIFDPLSRAVEVAESGGERALVPEVRLPLGRTFADALSRLALNVLLGVIALVLGIWLGPLPGVFAAAVIGLLDYTSPAYLRRGHTLGAQWRRLRTRVDADTLLFAAFAGALSLVPFVGLLLAPGLVAGGTLLTRRREQRAAPRP